VARSVIANASVTASVQHWNPKRPNSARDLLESFTAPRKQQGNGCTNFHYNEALPRRSRSASISNEAVPGTSNLALIIRNPIGSIRHTDQARV
jgi:hypothetical protein